jgi:cell division septation protein DedD
VQTRYETEHDLRDLHEATGQDREISLGATTILGIFFALSLLCAVFFGFGYSMGRRSAQVPINPTESTATANVNGAKPAPGSPAAVKQSAATQSAVVPIDSPETTTPDDQTVFPVATAKPAASTLHPNAIPPPPAGGSAKAATAIPVSAAVPSPGSPVVQVAAMSHQEDADVVAVDLKRRGYTVAIRRESQDKLFHVQIGPFSTKKDADTMRLRLQTDGYNNAIVK